MALRLSTGLRTAMLGGTGGIKDLMTNGVMDIFTGSQPVSADYVETGVKLVRISSTSGTGVADGLKFGTAAAGVLPIGTPAWTGPVLAAGVAGWFRFYGSGGISGTNGTALRFDGAVGIAGAELDLTHTNLALNSLLTITAANITQPAE